MTEDLMKNTSTIILHIVIATPSNKNTKIEENGVKFRNEDSSFRQSCSVF